MSETINFAPAMAAIVHGHELPEDLCLLAVLSAASVLIALLAGWVRQLGA